MIDMEMERLLRLHLEDLKRIGIKNNYFSEDQDISMNDIIDFALSYKILELDRLLSEGQVPDRKTLSSLRVYGELLKVFKNAKDIKKDNEKLSINDPLEKLKASIKIQELK